MVNIIKKVPASSPVLKGTILSLPSPSDKYI